MLLSKYFDSSEDVASLYLCAVAEVELYAKSGDYDD